MSTVHLLQRGVVWRLIGICVTPCLDVYCCSMGDLQMFAGECCQSAVLQEVRRIAVPVSIRLQYLECNTTATRADMLLMVQRGALQQFQTALGKGHDVAVCAITPPRKKRNIDGEAKVMPTVWAAVKGPTSVV